MAERNLPIYDVRLERDGRAPKTKRVHAESSEHALTVAAGNELGWTSATAEVSPNQDPNADAVTELPS